MENFENWNKNARKRNLNSNNENLDDSLNLNENENLSQRDYDKDPIIIKDYHQIFNSVLSWFSAFIAFTILLNLYIFIYSYLLNATDDSY